MSSIAPRIVYVGLPLGALALAHAGFMPVAVALGHPDALGARRVHALRTRGVHVLDAPDLAQRDAQASLLARGGDVLLSWFWPKRLPAAFLARFERGAFGVHPSLLPAWRGPDPYFWSILAGDAQTGVTLHRLAAAYDTGAIVAQRSLDILPTDTSWSLAKRLDRPSLALLRECAASLATGELLHGVAQDDAHASSAPRPSDEQLAIVWNRPTRAILRLIRAAAPLPGASTELAGQIVEVTRASAFGAPLPSALEPAEAVLAPGHGVVVRTGDGGILLEHVRTEAGTMLVGDAVATLFGGALSTLA